MIEVELFDEIVYIREMFPWEETVDNAVCTGTVVAFKSGDIFVSVGSNTSSTTKVKEVLTNITKEKKSKSDDFKNVLNVSKVEEKYKVFKKDVSEVALQEFLNGTNVGHLYKLHDLIVVKYLVRVEDNERDK